MTPYELLVVVAAQLASDGARTLEGAVAAGRELIDIVRREEPDLAGAHDRARTTEAQRRAAQAKPPR